MKKLIVSAIAVLVLAGCGGGGSKTVTKTCSMDIMEGMSFAAVIDGKDNKVSALEIRMTMDGAKLGTTIDKMDDATKKQTEQAMLQQMGLTGDEKGITTNLESKDNKLVVGVKVDLEKADKAALDKIGFDIEADQDFDAAVKSLEEASMTCK